MTFDPVTSTLIIAVYMLLVLAVGLIAWRIAPSYDIEDYLLADRTISWFVGFFSFAATLASALAFMGFIGFYFKFGLPTFIVTTGANVILLSGMFHFFGLEVWKIGRKFGHITPSETVREYYDSPLLGYTMAVALILGLIPYLQVQFTGVGILLELGTGGMVSYFWGVGIITVLIALYTWLGGMKSVAWVDTMQGIMLLGGAFLGGIVLIYTVGDGFTAAYDHIKQHRPALLTIPGPIPVFDWLYIMTFSFAFMPTAFFFPQLWLRIHYFESSRSVKMIPWVWALILWLTQIGGWATVLTGVTVIPDAPPDQFLLLMYRKFFPTVVFALIASAALAAMMSTASSLCHAIGALVSRDLSQTLRPDWGEGIHLLIARLSTAVAIVAAFLLSLAGIPFLVTSGAAATSLIGSAILPQGMAAILGWRWPTREGAISGGVLGFIVAVLLLAVPPIPTNPLGIYGGFWGIIVNTVVFTLVSLGTSGHPSSETVSRWVAALRQPATDLEKEYREQRKTLTGGE